MDLRATMTPPLAPATTGTPEARPSADQLREAGEGFEALFLTMLLKSGRAGLPGDDLTGSGAVTSGIEMLDAQLARDGATRAGLGISDAVVRQFGGTGTAQGAGR